MTLFPAAIPPLRTLGSPSGRSGRLISWFVSQNLQSSALGSCWYSELNKQSVSRPDICSVSLAFPTTTSPSSNPSSQNWVHSNSDHPNAMKASFNISCSRGRIVPIVPQGKAYDNIVVSAFAKLYTLASCAFTPRPVSNR